LEGFLANDAWRGVSMGQPGLRHKSRLGARHFGVACVLVCTSLFATAFSAAAPKANSQGQVLYVGTFHHIATPPGSTFTSIQAAVDAAASGDWILIAPGDYRETGDMGKNVPTPVEVQEGWYGGIDITTSDIHLRGMSRSGVVIDGTKAGSPTPCASAPADQNTLNGDGRNGIVVWKANGVTIDNLTVCNFIAGTGASGNEIWWNGGYGSGRIGIKGYSGSYLTATSTYFANSEPGVANVCGTCALYGVFASNADAKGGVLNQLYANNFADSGMYVGACLQLCDVTIENAVMEDNALGYSGTNSGGQIVIENSTFDNNKEGLDTNTALTGDPPPPQNGTCPKNAVSPITKSHSCWVFMDNLVKDNNNPNVPIFGTAGLGPTGTGMTVSGGHDDTVMDNEFLGNGAWGILFVPYPDSNTSSDGRTCTSTGGIIATSIGISGLACLYDPEGNAALNNKFSGNGSFGNPSNADYGNLLAAGGEPWNCFSGNTEWNSAFTQQTGSAKSADSSAQLTPSTCSGNTPAAGLLGSNTDLTLLSQAECDSGVLNGCASGYPKVTQVVMQPLPPLTSMPNPCQGVPTNLWCPGGKPKSDVHRAAAARGSIGIFVSRER
jgi:hypothetical protein